MSKPLLDFITKNLPSVLEQETQDTLGDRSTYIGASDIGGCPYKTVMSKKNPPKYSLQQQIVFQRGHIAEDLVSKMLKGLDVEDQHEVLGEVDNFKLKSHLDKLLKAKNRCVIIEVKTVSAPVSEPFESWVLQVTQQMGLILKECGHKVEAYVLAIDLNSGWIDTFKIEFNEAIFQMCLNKASHIIAALRGECEPEAIVQYYCSTCPFKMTCPKQGKFAEDLPSDLAEDLEFIKAAKVMEKERKKREERVKSYMVNMGIDAFKDEATQSVVTNKEMQSSRINSYMLKSKYPEIYNECLNTSSYFRMNII